MKKAIKKLNLILAIILILTLASCGNGKTDYTIDTKRNNDKGSEKITISYAFFGDADTINATKEAIEKFEILYPKIKVRMVYYNPNEYEEQLSKMLIRGQETDLMQASYYILDEYSQDGTGFYNLATLNSYLDFSTISSDYLKLGKRNNYQVGIPASINTSIPVYNESILEKYEIEIADSLFDMKSLTKVLRPYKIYPFGMDKEDTLLWILSYYEQCYGFSVFDKAGKNNMNKAYMEEVLNLYKQLVTSKILCPVDKYSDELFINGSVLGTIIYSNELYNLTNLAESNNEKIKIGDYFKLAKSKRSGIFYIPTYFYVIDKKTDHPNETATLLNYLLNSSENALTQKTMNGIPLSNSAEKVLMEYGLISPNEYLVNASLDYNFKEAYIRPIVLDSEEYLDSFIDILNKFINDEITDEEAADEFYKIQF